ncbi:MAG TPA: TlpA disulfide reductase family protein [Pyrinomonadaceae bacterium]|nr:TlpA disulfide reductase family protein [Pyrinomonadaceae bacterium]
MRKSLLIVIILVSAIACFGQTDGAVDTVPSFVARDMDGKQFSMADFKGKVVVVNLWFINCPNCLAEIKALNEIVEQYRSEPDVVFVAPAASKQQELVSFLQKNPFKYRVLPDSLMMIISQFGRPDKSGEINVPFPMHYVVDRDGKTVVKKHGLKGVEAVKAELAKQFPAKRL